MNNDNLTSLNNPLGALPYAAATFVGGFLVFQVQPIVAKCILPWFGNSPAVWTTYLLFFQVLILAGYLYAHFLQKFLRPRRQGLVHLTLLAIALWSLNVIPDESWKPSSDKPQMGQLLLILAVHLGLPFFLLSSTAPLIQSWLALRTSSSRIYRLFALSNLGSLTALLSYPLLVEPKLSIDSQAAWWTFFFIVFVMIQAGMVYRLVTRRGASLVANAPDVSKEQSDSPRWQRILWVLLPALSSALLLVTISQLSSEQAVMPLIWVLPLGIYFLSIVLTFDSPRFYQPKWTAAAATVSLVVLQLAWIIPESFRMMASASSSVIFLLSVSLLCHGELARLQPSINHLTRFYASFSLGVVFGGILIALACPLLLTTYSEIPVVQAVCGTVAFLVLLAHRGWGWTEEGRTTRCWRSLGWMRWLALILPLLSIGAAYQQESPGTLHWERNLFGVLRVDDEKAVRVLNRGAIPQVRQRHSHYQFEPTDHYGRHSGVGKAIIAMGGKESLRIGVVGLGCGALASYGRLGDQFDFIEINPAIVRIAQQKFNFIRDSYADVSLRIGDGRLVLEQTESNRYDLLVIDLMNNYPLPVHQMTSEAIALYKRLLRPGGMLAIHVTSDHLNLAAVVHRLANEHGLESRLVTSHARPKEQIEAAMWVLASDLKNPLWDAPELWEAIGPTSGELENAPRWTDKHYDLWSVLRFK